MADGAARDADVERSRLHRDRVHEAVLRAPLSRPPSAHYPWGAQSAAGTDVRLRMVIRQLVKQLSAHERAWLSLEALDPQRQYLLADRRGQWFRPPRGRPCDLVDKPQLVRMLARLIQERCTAPCRPVGADELIEVGWPDERILPQPAIQRLYKSMSRLRKQGLGELLLRRDEGYLLDPAVSLARVDSAGPPSF